MIEPLALQNRPATQRTLLNSLKKAGALSVQTLARDAKITVSGARQHLALLEGDGLICRTSETAAPSPARGRPTVLYQLTAVADALYPRSYGELTNELLEYLEPATLEGVFVRRRERRIAQAKSRLEPLDTLEARVYELARILDEDGYLADVLFEPGGFRIVEHNCAIFTVAKKYGQACGSELEFIRAALHGAEVSRVSHMMVSGHVCAYSIQPKAIPNPKGTCQTHANHH